MIKENYFTKIKNKLLRKFSNDLAIDLGTANSLVYVSGKGIVINEPSVVAVNSKTNTTVAVGSFAKEMLGKTPMHIKAVRPIVDGVISNYEMALEMISYLINKAEENNTKFYKILGPRVVVAVPSGITNVETRAIVDATIEAGAREVHIVEEPMAAAIGEGLPVKSAEGTIILDIGGGTSDIAIISLGGVVNYKNLKIAGDKMNNDIIDYMKNYYKLLIGEKTAEKIKIKTASVMKNRNLFYKVRGKDLSTGLPKEIKVTSDDTREAIEHSISTIVSAVRDVVEKSPPEIISDTISHGIYLTGGGAQIDGLADLISDHLGGVKVTVVSDPLKAVINGEKEILENFSTFKDVLLRDTNELPLKL